LNNTHSIPSKFMWKLVFNVFDVIFKFESPKRKTHKVHKNNAPSKTFQNICFWEKKFEKIYQLGALVIATHMDLWKYGQIWTIQKSLVIKWLNFSKRRFFICVYHLILHYIFNPNNKFGMWMNIYIYIFIYFFNFFFDVQVKRLIHIFWLQKFITTNKWIFYQ
jgi:hypothetical protein